MKDNISLPDFRNIGVILRTLILAEMVNLSVAHGVSKDFGAVLDALAEGSTLYEPILLLAVFCLYLLSPILQRLIYRQGVMAVFFVVTVLVLGWLSLFRGSAIDDQDMYSFRLSLNAWLVTGGILAYFNWRHRVQSPAIAEARLMALQARIRPHFLYNSLNTVIGLIRPDPIRAEHVLQNLSDLYRSLMTDAKTLLPLSREVELARAYLEIEGVRLGERLNVAWQCDAGAMDAVVPPLILQPLVENAVYHGIEPTPRGGTVSVSVARKGNKVTLIVRNTCTSANNVRSGNHMALDNIRERLDLHFDAEARMSAYRTDDEYVVRITLPYKHA